MISAAAAAKEDPSKIILQQLETMKSTFSDNCDIMRDEIDHYFEFDADFGLTDPETF